MMNPFAKKLFLKTLDACAPARLIERQCKVRDSVLHIEGNEWSLKDRPVYVLAVGKAAVPMSRALQKLLSVKDGQMICITPQHHSGLSYAIAASHPVPDALSVNAAGSVINFMEQISAGALVIAAISGGTSALLCKPAAGIRPESINEMNRLLLSSGVNIHELNSVRKHLSAIKGGQLLRHFNPNCTLIDVVISDVPSNDVSIIGSGPTAADTSTFGDAYDVLLRYDLWEGAPREIRTHIEKGLQGEVSETMKPGADPLQEHQAFVIGSARKFGEIMVQQARQAGYETQLAPDVYNAPVQEVVKTVKKFINQYETSRPAALIFYGESTVQVSGDGRGGRNQELSLRGALKIAGMQDVTWLSAGTDGVDGPTDAAGGIVDGQTIAHARQMEMDAQDFLRRNDSYHFHEKAGTLLKTGPTGNNLMDVVLVLLD